MTSLIEKSKRLGLSILDLVFPISCLVCGKDGSYLCNNCRAQLPRLETQQCLVCQKPSPFGKTHMECVSRNTVDGIISALPYPDKNVKRIVEVLKYNFVSDLAKPLAGLLMEEIAKQNLSDYFSEFQIIPVPLHIRRQNWRGFNQAALLGQEIAEQIHIPLNSDLIKRVRFTKPQTTLSQAERKTNIQNAFDSSVEIKNKKFLIVDDVVTTGSTINEIAKLLKRQGALEVWSLTAARG